MLGFGLELAHEVSDVDVAGANGTQVSDRDAVIVRDIGDSDGVFVDIHPDEKRVGRGRLCHG
jgi:hypothetical protein